MGRRGWQGRRAEEQGSRGEQKGREGKEGREEEGEGEEQPGEKRGRKRGGIGERRNREEGEKGERRNSRGRGGEERIETCKNQMQGSQSMPINLVCL